MAFFLNDILHSFVALYGRKGFKASALFKATSFDIPSPHGFYLYGKIEVVPLELISSSSSPVQN